MIVSPSADTVARFTLVPPAAATQGANPAGSLNVVFAAMAFACRTSLA